MRTTFLLRFMLLVTAAALAASGCTRISGHVLQAEPELVDFGYVPPPSFSSEASIEISNTGGSSVQILDIRIAEEGAEAFQLLLLPASFPMTLGAGSSETITAVFGPPASGEYLGWIEVETDADTDSPFLVPLGGCSTHEDCEVEFVDPVGDDDDDDDDDDPDIDVDPVAIDFGSIPQNQSVINDVLVISNAGAADLDISSIELSSSDGSDAWFSTGTFSGVVLPPESAPLYLDVSFDPLGAPEGLRTATLTILSNDPDEGSLQIALSAEVTEDCGACPPELVVEGGAPLNVFLGEILYVQVPTGSVSVTISNTGTGPLPIDPLSEGGEVCDDNPAFSYLGGAPAQLLPGESASLDFSVGQEGLEVVNLAGTYSFTMGTLAPDPAALLEYAFSAPYCDPLGM